MDFCFCINNIVISHVFVNKDRPLTPLPLVDKHGRFDNTPSPSLCTWFVHNSMGLSQIGHFWIKSTEINWHFKPFYPNSFIVVVTASCKELDLDNNKLMLNIWKKTLCRKLKSSSLFPYWNPHQFIGCTHYNEHK